jgi:hypothetical protein
MPQAVFKNPFRPGAGHMPPYLAGRDEETGEFERLLEQDIILENMVLTGLRGVGKTVLLDTLKPLAMRTGWSWVGTDLSESTSVTENTIAVRLLTDLSVVTTSIVIDVHEMKRAGFKAPTEKKEINLSFAILSQVYENTPGLVADKLKTVLQFVWAYIAKQNRRGLIFAYDEAQNLSDHAEKNQYPLSLLLDVFQAIQKQNIPFMLALTGLPTLFPKLVEARTFSERMFRVVFLDKLNRVASRDAITKPIEDEHCPVKFGDESVDIISTISGGYPYFIQFICREVYDVFIQQIGSGTEPGVPVDEIIRKLDTDFFSGRWARATDRQRELLGVVARLESADSEFTVQEIVELSKKILEKPFSPSHTNQMLSSLSANGLVYKNRHGKYSFAVPLLGEYILRQIEQNM